VPRLGYGPFLWTYQRNQHRYVAKHHGRGWAALLRVATVAGMMLRCLLLPLRKPRRATSRRAAAGALTAAALGALTRWQAPQALARQIPRSAGRRSRETT
jgi:ferric-dicitrate binding protein FerR (iron transport regulator)